MYQTLKVIRKKAVNRKETQTLRIGFINDYPPNAVGEGESVMVGVGVFVNVGGTGVFVNVAEGVKVIVGVKVGVNVLVAVNVAVLVGVYVNVGVNVIG
jgi:hypothetical protein